MDLDDVDRGILSLLQEDTRRLTTQEMADSVGVSARTVRGRIEQMEAAGVIRGYRAGVDHDDGCPQLEIQLAGSAPTNECERLEWAAREVNGVVADRTVLDRNATRLVAETAVYPFGGVSRDLPEGDGEQ